jgi:hypothetical protein
MMETPLLETTTTGKACAAGSLCTLPHVTLSDTKGHECPDCDLPVPDCDVPVHGGIQYGVPSGFLEGESLSWGIESPQQRKTSMPRM